jgi:hypothetical protein
MRICLYPILVFFVFLVVNFLDCRRLNCLGGHLLFRWCNGFAA